MEKERARWLSEDCTRSASPRPRRGAEMDSRAQQQFSEAVEAREARGVGQGVGILRQYKDQNLTALLSYVRGRIWEDVGHPWWHLFSSATLLKAIQRTQITGLT